MWEFSYYGPDGLIDRHNGPDAYLDNVVANGGVVEYDASNWTVVSFPATWYWPTGGVLAVRPV